MSSGIIDTLSAGFGAINRRPWVIGIPVLLDLFLWLGPRLSADAVLARTLAAYQKLEPGAQTSEQMAELARTASGSNVFAVLAWQLPSIVNTRSAASLGERVVLNVPGEIALLGLLFALGVFGLLGTCLYLGAISLLVRGEPFDRAAYLGNLWLNFRRLLSYWALLLGVTVVGGIPLGIVVVLVGVFSPAVGAFLTFLVMTLALWAFLYLFFASYAIFAGGRGPLLAIWESVNLVARHFWPAVMLFVLVHVILIGTTMAWSGALAHPAGVVAAILGNAYIASGLAAAAMIFYRERVQPAVRRQGRAAA